jgi:hypothetical protein
VHPFGTANACVFLADGTYLEPLALADAQAARAAARHGNMFTRRNLAYRYRSGQEGFSALAFGSTDAAADHAGFLAAGISGGDMLEFGRDFVDPAGRVERASFRLAFAADWRAPDSFFFTCQRMNAPKTDRASLMRHANGAARIRSIIMSAPHEADFVDFVLAAAGAPAAEGVRDGALIDVANARLEIHPNAAIRDRFGRLPGDATGLRLRAIVFGIGDPAAAEALFAAAEISYERHGGQLVVPPAPGQGAVFVFEAE